MNNRTSALPPFFLNSHPDWDEWSDGQVSDELNKPAIVRLKANSWLCYRTIGFLLGATKAASIKSQMQELAKTNPLAEYIDDLLKDTSKDAGIDMGLQESQDTLDQLASLLTDISSDDVNILKSYGKESVSQAITLMGRPCTSVDVAEARGRFPE